MTLNNKVVVVTGGAGLLGEAFVKAISVEGGIPIIAETNFKAAKKDLTSLFTNLSDDVQIKESSENILYKRMQTNEHKTKKILKDSFFRSKMMPFEQAPEKYITDRYPVFPLVEDGKYTLITNL